MRISGHLGAIHLAGNVNKVADTYNWTLELTTKVERASVKMDRWERKVPGRGDGTLTIDAHITTKAFLTTEQLDAVNLGEQLSFDLWDIDGNATFDHISGTGYVSRGRVGMPHDALATDTIEITLDGAPTFA